MKIDLHIHSKNGSDGKWPLDRIFPEAARRLIDVMSITDHDAIHCQEEAMSLATRYGIAYIPGVELNIAFSHPSYQNGKAVSLDLLGYGYDIRHQPLIDKLEMLRDFRKKRAETILGNINGEFEKEGRRERFTDADMDEIQTTVDGAFGRPHIANYMVSKGIVKDKWEAFEKYLVKCNVPKMPVSLEEASGLMRSAGGKIILAHPNDPNGTSLMSLTPSRTEQQQIIRESMAPFIDGVECWHPRHDKATASSYCAFAVKEGLMATGGSDCHQQPVVMGTVDVPDWVVEQFDIK
jgi:predicted metal-dependent phosphoesterase TrpH